MSLLLEVPVDERDTFENSGVRWNTAHSKCIIDRNDYQKFAKLILNGNRQLYIVCDYLYIVEGKFECFNCKNTTKVLRFGVENYYDLFNDDDGDEYDDSFAYESGIIRFAPYIEPLSDIMSSFLQQKYLYKLGYSKMFDREYVANHCHSCGNLIDHVELFQEMHSPFFIDCAQVASELTLYRIELEHDIIVKADVGFGQRDQLIKACANIFDLENVFGI